MRERTKQSAEILGEAGEPRGHDDALQSSLSYRAFNIELDSLLPYEEFFDSTFSYDWTDGVVDHVPSLDNHGDRSRSRSPAVLSHDQAQGDTLRDDGSSPTRSVRGETVERSKSVEGVPIEQSELLQFTPLPQKSSVIDCNWEPVPISIAAELQGNFFLATPEPNSTAELTFSRRNLFRIAGSISKIPRPCYFIDDNGGRTAILNADVCVTGTESKEGKKIDVIQVPWKTTAPPTSPLVRNTSAPGHHIIPLELGSNTQISSGKTTLPFMWKRLQFKNSTANNGRRNGVQQKYRLKLTLTANLATGEKVSLLEAETGAIIVRGRSAWTSARSEEPNPSVREQRLASQVVTRRPRKAFRTGDPISPNEITSRIPSNHTAAATPVGSRLKDRSLIPSLRLDSEMGALDSATVPEQTPSLYSRPKSATSMQKTLDHTATGEPLTDDNVHVGESSNKKSSTRKASPSINLDPDPLYEYFPLGIEGWMPPVDAVYRPHVAHNTSLAPDLQALVDKGGLSWTGPQAGKPSNWS
ncbi:hypothetical protein EDD36DRAFT_492185 [Exophiala viscosa]|uniref:NDT80 domain-containing protein n=1 Tax=Exophiala viscosa TaxID=2486360 RepID=A0AAN6E7T0_9EURO|nr:hypothetical protein EDD36DRAFT_492185 [Exophiala viscosa]